MGSGTGPATPLPEAIAAYFAAANAGDSGTLARCFTADAVVRDEGHEFRGTLGIRGWKEETDKKYRPAFEATAVREERGSTIVTTRVSGDFPGSPILLDFIFRLRDGRVASLEIRS